MEAKAHQDRTQDLAMRIYVELVARATDLSEGKVKMTASATNIATLSLKLSEAFLVAEAEAIEARAPVKNFKLGSDDIAKWDVK
jgi:hypothetical protein